MYTTAHTALVRITVDAGLFKFSVNTYSKMHILHQYCTVNRWIKWWPITTILGNILLSRVLHISAYSLPSSGTG